MCSKVFLVKQGTLKLGNRETMQYILVNKKQIQLYPFKGS